MSIAILGWGSLIWKPTANDETLSCDGVWCEDGPALPIEFARKATDGRVTLVLLAGAPHTCRSLWTRSTLETLDEARDNLSKREGMPSPAPVHGVRRDGSPVGTPDPDIAGTVEAWLPDGVDSALWTGLPTEPSWMDADGEFIPDRALEYAAGLDCETRRRAREYVERAPAQTATPLRQALLEALSG